MERKDKDQGRNEQNENFKKYKKVNETKSWFFEKINNIDRPLAKLSKRKKKTQIIITRDEKVDTTINTINPHDH
jgi:hypothetical protein